MQPHPLSILPTTLERRGKAWWGQSPGRWDSGKCQFTQEFPNSPPSGYLSQGWKDRDGSVQFTSIY